MGIDLGTTFSAVACLSEDGTPRILPNREGDDETPSVVFFPPGGDKDEPLVGIMAKNSIGMSPENTVQFIKRAMGSDHWRFTSPSGAEYSPEEISAIILRRLVADAELVLGGSVGGAVITVPAYFGDVQRTATIQAAQIAGIQVLGLLNEPTAAALAFGVKKRDNATVLVYDLGGGTFDVTIMQYSSDFDPPGWHEIGKLGDSNLGGLNWDDELTKLIIDRIADEGGPVIQEGDLDQISQLRDRAEDAKRTLTTVENATVMYSVANRSYRVRISRREFEERTAGLLDRTKELVSQALGDSGLDWEDLENVLLVGGSTFMPQVTRMLRDLTGKELRRDVDPKKAVALGASMRTSSLEETGGVAVRTGGQASRKGNAGGAVPAMPRDRFGEIVEESTSHALGVIMVRPDDRVKVNTVVIPRNTRYSEASGQVIGLTAEDKQATFTVRVTQGEGEDLSAVAEIGSVTFEIPEYPALSKFVIRCQCDRDERVFVEVADCQADKSLGVFQVKRRANLALSEVEKSREKVMGLILE